MSQGDTFTNHLESVTLENLVRTHYDISGSPRRAMTVVCGKQNESLAMPLDFVEDNLGALEVAVDCLCVSALASREFFTVSSLAYCNAASFEWYRYLHPMTEKTIHAWSRKRDGEIFHAFDLQKFRRVAPIQCATGTPITIDKDLLAALVDIAEQASHQDEDAKAILQSIRWFCHGNRDDTFTDIRWDIGMMASALEILMGVNKEPNKGDTLGRELRKAFERTSGAVGQHEITEKWAKEFYNCRHEPIHGNRVPKVEWEKYIRHPTMAAFVFPLALKHQISLKGVYRLGEEDVGRIEAVALLLGIETPERWADRVAANLTRWQKVVQDRVRYRQVRGELEKCLAPSEKTSL